MVSESIRKFDFGGPKGEKAVIPGFEKAKKSSLSEKRLIMSIEGKEKSGKTTLALTAPGPIALFNMDIGLEGVIEKFVEEKDIIVAEFDYRDATSANEWVEMWERMKKMFDLALKNKSVRSIVFDTATEMWELCRLARFAKLTQVQPYHYGPVNAEFRDLIRKVYKTNKNLILVHKLKAEYLNDKRTGEMERSGFGDTGYLTQVNVRCWRRLEVGKAVSLNPDGAGEEGFGLTVLECRPNAAVAQMELETPLSTFPFLATQIYPDTEEEYWE